MPAACWLLANCAALIVQYGTALLDSAVCVSVWPQIWSTRWFIWTWKTHGILKEFCAASGKTDFARWVQPVFINPYAAKCIWCTKTVDLSNAGRQALVSHMTSNWCGMILDIWRSLLRILFVAITAGKVQLWLWKSLENSGNFFSATLWPACDSVVDVAAWWAVTQTASVVLYVVVHLVVLILHAVDMQTHPPDHRW